MTSRLPAGAEVSRRSLVKLGAGLGLLAASGQSEAAGADDMAPDNMTFESRIMVPMRDGVKLATDVYRPAREGKALPGPFPVILERTPYGRDHVADYPGSGLAKVTTIEPVAIPPSASARLRWS
jgi:predicted acyl esterase